MGRNVNNVEIKDTADPNLNGSSNAAMGKNVNMEQDCNYENITDVPSNSEMSINTDRETPAQHLTNQDTVYFDSMCGDAIMGPLDPYLDARLSGALEQLNDTEMTALNTLVTMGLMQPSADVSSSNGTVYTCIPVADDHTYCQTNPSDRVSTITAHNETSMPHGIPLEEDSPETFEPYVCEVDMGVHDMFNNLDYNAIDIIPECELVQGINNDIDTDQLTTQVNANLDVDNAKGINTTTQITTLTVMGTNIIEMDAESHDCDPYPYDTDDTIIYDPLDDSSDSNFEGFTLDDLPAANLVPVYDSPEKHEKLKTTTKQVQETDIDSQLTSSSDSNFEGFTAQDLYRSVHLNKTWDSSSLTDSSSGSSGASVKENSENNNISENQFGNITVNPIGLIENMWKKDAIAKKWTVLVEKMNKKKIYELSNRPPDWDNIDPYSDLEEINSDQQTNEDSGCDQELKPPEQGRNSANYVKTIQNKYHLWERKPVTGMDTTLSVTYTEHDSNSSDSDFSLNPKRQRNRNMRLREPSRSRLRAQEIITATNVNKKLNHEKTFLVRATEQPKDKGCPYCDEMFYYLSGVQTHVTHTHSNIVSMNGITASNVMGVNSQSMMGTNVNRQSMMDRNENSKNIVMGTNEVETPSTTTISGIDENVKETKVQSGHTSSPSRSEPNSSFSHHKRRPKHRGKHYQPKPKPEPSSSDETVTESRKKSPKSEFVTVTHGIRKTKKIR